ncbi:hypothetical protein R3W88_003873 [Solanum pinnatisectum]|uniref:Uncharacterized protein n=1 Tax=Solanum pinnatisectum TaxID=50273 RepID=A0AAV9MQX0_9SOLN|nr:hypothetical protein R3W88_003873 [Solanum pinnatisectum]
MDVVILDRFCGTGNPEGWLYRAEQYFTFLGFDEEYWLLFLHSILTPPNKSYQVERTTGLGNFQTSIALHSPYETQTWKEDHVFDKLPEKYHIVDEPSVVTKDSVFAEMSYTTMSPNFHDPNASVHDEEHSALVGSKVSDTSICGNDRMQPEVTIQVLDESFHDIKFREVRSIAPRVSLLVLFDGPEIVRPNEHLEQDISTRYVGVNSIASDSPKWKTDLETFVDWYLADFFMEPVGNENLYLNILTSSMHSVKICPDTENGKSTRTFNGQNILSQFSLVPAADIFLITIPVIAIDLCVWDPRICLEFLALTDFTENIEELLLLGCTGKFFFNADSNSMSRVWDPDKHVVGGLFVVNHDILVANFDQPSVWRHEIRIDLDMEQVESDLKFVPLKDNREFFHYNSFRSLVYFVGSSTRIVHLDKWFSGQMLTDNVPRQNNMLWLGNYGLKEGKYVALTMFQNLVEVCHNVGEGLQFSLPLSCIVPMLSWSVSEYHANYEVVVELNHANDVIIAAFIMMSIPSILWSIGHLEKLQGFSHHSHVQLEVNYAATTNKTWCEALDFALEVNYAATINKTWYEAGDFAYNELAGARHQMHFMHLEVTVTTHRLPTLLLVRFLDLNLEDKVLIEDGSIVMNQPQPNRDTNKDNQFVNPNYIVPSIRNKQTNRSTTLLL